MVGTSNKLITYLLEQAKDKKFEITEYKEKRSLNANGYCWILCDKIAEELSKEGTTITKVDVYRDAILQVGVFTPEIWELKDYEEHIRRFQSQGLGNIVQEVAKKDKCIKVHCYYGSSTYNTKEMSRLIQIIVELAESLNIETKTPQEIQSLLESWNSK